MVYRTVISFAFVAFAWFIYCAVWGGVGYGIFVGVKMVIEGIFSIACGLVVLWWWRKSFEQHVLDNNGGGKVDMNIVADAKSMFSKGQEDAAKA